MDQEGAQRFNKFETALSSLAIDVHQNEVSSKCSNKSTTADPKAAKKSNATATKDKEDENQKANGGKKSKKRKRDDTEWTDKCLNSKCDKSHMLCDCPDTSPELKKKLLRKRWEEEKKRTEENKKQKTAKALKGTTSEDQTSPHTDDGRFKIVINDVVYDVALSDYGSDFNEMSNFTFTKVLQATLNVTLEPFTSPIELVGAFKTDKETFSASKSVVLNINLSCLAPT